MAYLVYFVYFIIGYVLGSVLYPEEVLAGWIGVILMLVTAIYCDAYRYLNK